MHHHRTAYSVPLPADHRDRGRWIIPSPALPYGIRRLPFSTLLTSTGMEGCEGATPRRPDSDQSPAFRRGPLQPRLPATSLPLRVGRYSWSSSRTDFL